MLAGDLNGHTGQERTGYRRWHGGETVGQRNQEGERILEIARIQDLAIVNTFFHKKGEHWITFRSGKYHSVIDYILVRREAMGKIRNCKVIPGESVATQHRLMVMGMRERKSKEKKRKHKERIRWWKLKESEG